MRRSQLPDTINNIALQIVENRIKRHAFLLALAVIGISIMSYHFGTFDQSIHIPFLKAAADPTLYPNDPFVALRHEHYSYFWLMFIPFYQLGVLEETLFIVHVIITYFTYWTIYKLGWTLFQKPTSAMFATLAFVFPHASFCGFPLIEFSLLNRTFVLPFLILAINLYLRGIRARSFFMLGILYNLHVLSVHFVLAMFALDFILEYRKIGWKKILNCIVVFIIAALPVLLWKLQDSGTEIQLEPGWFDLITRTMMMHVFFLFGNIYVTAASLSALSAYILFFIAYRAKSVKTETDHTVLIFVLASTLVVLAEVIVAAWFPISIILQLQIMRAGIFAVFFAYLYFGDYLAKKWTGDSIRRAGDGVVTMTFFLSTLTFVTAILILLQKWWSASQRRVTRIAIALAIGFIGSLIFAVVANVWYPGIHIYGLDNTWRDTQEWARNHTSNDAIFITPLNKWWLDEAEWRVFSERQNVTALSEILEASFEPEYIDHWRARMETLAPGAIDQFRGNYLINQQIAGTLYNSLSTDALLDAACTFNAGYIVVEKDHPHELTKVYENADYIIYDVRAACK